MRSDFGDLLVARVSGLELYECQLSRLPYLGPERYGVWMTVLSVMDC